MKVTKNDDGEYTILECDICGERPIYRHDGLDFCKDCFKKHMAEKHSQQILEQFLDDYFDEALCYIEFEYSSDEDLN